MIKPVSINIRNLDSPLNSVSFIKNPYTNRGNMAKNTMDGCNKQKRIAIEQNIKIAIGLKIL